MAGQVHVECPERAKRVEGSARWHLANPTSSLHRRHMAFVYIVRCADQSLYVGSTDDVDARIVMHNEGRGSQYTKQRRPVTLVFVEAHDTADAARQRERQLKGWTAAKKEALIEGDSVLLKHLAISHGSPRIEDD